jgi:hypothetical protein
MCNTEDQVLCKDFLLMARRAAKARCDLDRNQLVAMPCAPTGSRPSTRSSGLRTSAWSIGLLPTRCSRD